MPRETREAQRAELSEDIWWVANDVRGCVDGRDPTSYFF